jgi:hypothetical protein
MSDDTQAPSSTEPVAPATEPAAAPAAAATPAAAPAPEETVHTVLDDIEAGIAGIGEVPAHVFTWLQGRLDAIRSLL